MPQLPNRELFEPVGNGGEEEGELEVVEKIRKTVATIGNLLRWWRTATHYGH